MNNPFLAPLPESGVPVFDGLTVEHYREAFDLGFAAHLAEVETIKSNSGPSTFSIRLRHSRGLVSS